MLEQRGKNVKEYLRMMRIHHYVKNVLILFPLFFSGEMGNLSLLLKNLYGFAAFCMANSFVYIMNDLKDRERDRIHPIKKERPIASGRISVQKAIITEILLFIGMGIVLLVGKMNIFAVGCCYVYLFINFLYSFGGKNIPVLDVALLGAGYLIRVLFGGYVSNIQVSSWLFLTVMCISFYLGLGKRHGELVKPRGGVFCENENTGTTRLVLEKYTASYLEGHMYLCLGLGIVFYSLWAIERLTALTYTVPLVVVICMKYNLLMIQTDGDPINTIYSSKSMILLLGGYVILIAGILYF